MEDLVAIARIARPHGLRGELLADILTDFPERFEGLRKVTAVMPGERKRQLEIESFRYRNERILLKFLGIDRIEDAEEFRNAEICITENETVALDDDEFFDWQLEGCKVSGIDGDLIGEVSSVMRTGGTEVLVVNGAKEYLIPFAATICVMVDIPNKLITVDPPEGLLEF
ncbi:ribosome maturation factor RimM [Leptolyngbya sp. 7M]|uniref:ribosome maturation factor RimM n=1 Tax=Leptolyngbya sp. 7M TaxID=2812896 RepID=UPI001B8D0699|nr:ribosome maturation factor RimM [Leptolyngbya sp. 7M]QYO65940.1 ribosome maturation factor RimM [Leptolyngbya sp. 7M]